MRQSLARIAKTLKQNKALESCKINGLLLVSLDANEHFHSRSRCCECCCQRQVEETDAQRGWVVVLKQEDREAYQEALQLTKGQKPFLTFEDKERKRQVQLWEVKDLQFSEEYRRPIRVVRSEEHWVEKRIRGGRKRPEPRQSRWLWAVRAELDGYGPWVIYRGGPRRWGIENKACNELTQAYHLEHCYHQEPTSLLAQMLILLLAFPLFTAFAQLHRKLIGLGKLTAKALAKEWDLALEQELPWEQWFHCG